MPTDDFEQFGSETDVDTLIAGLKDTGHVLVLIVGMREDGELRIVAPSSAPTFILREVLRAVRGFIRGEIWKQEREAKH